MTLLLAAPARADAIDLRCIDGDGSFANLHPSGAIREKEHYLFHSSTWNELNLERELSSAEPDHGKWVRVSPQNFASPGLFDVDDDYFLVKRNGPNLGVFAFDLDGKATLSVSANGVFSRSALDDDDPSGDDNDDEQGNGSSSGPTIPGPQAAVPDGGPTAIMLGLSFLAIGVLRRKSSNS